MYLHIAYMSCSRKSQSSTLSWIEKMDLVKRRSIRSLKFSHFRIKSYITQYSKLKLLTSYMSLSEMCPLKEFLRMYLLKYRNIAVDLAKVPKALSRLIIEALSFPFRYLDCILIVSAARR